MTKIFPELITHPYALLFVRSVIAVLLMAAGVSKLVNLQTFVQVVRDFRLLPEKLVKSVGLMIPIIEVIISLLLILGLLQPWTLITASCFFIMFGVAVAINLFRGRSNISCGCFGRGRNHRLTWGLVLRNVLLAGLAVVAAIAPTTSDSESQPTMIDTAALMIVAGVALASWRLGGLIRKNWQPLELDQSSIQSRTPP